MRLLKYWNLNLLGILCARNAAGSNAIGKFILIGDYKQLPQCGSAKRCSIRNTRRQFAFYWLVNLKESLFERLHRACLSAPKGAGG